MNETKQKITVLIRRSGRTEWMRTKSDRTVWEYAHGTVLEVDEATYTEYPNDAVMLANYSPVRRICIVPKSHVSIIRGSPRRPW